MFDYQEIEFLFKLMPDQPIGEVEKFFAWKWTPCWLSTRCVWLQFAYRRKYLYGPAGLHYYRVYPSILEVLKYEKSC